MADPSQENESTSLIAIEAEPVNVPIADLLVELYELRNSGKSAEEVDFQACSIEAELKERKVDTEWFASVKRDEDSEAMVEMFVGSYPKLKKISLSEVPSYDQSDPLQKKYVSTVSSILDKVKTSLNMFDRRVKFDFPPNAYVDSQEVFNSRLILDLKESVGVAEKGISGLNEIAEKVRARNVAISNYKEAVNKLFSSPF